MVEFPKFHPQYYSSMEFLEFFINRNSLVKNSDTITSLHNQKKKKTYRVIIGVILVIK